jgi:glycosyltransferase involved in cell wall biosynthesis
VKVLVVNNMAPFSWGGAEELAHHLQGALVVAGHEAEVIRVPFRWAPATGIPAQMLLVQALELSNVDRVIALKFPAYLIRHPQKTLWLLHQYRQAYDLYQTAHSNLREHEFGTEIKELIEMADKETFRDSRRIFVNSDVTQIRLSKFSGVDAEVLRPPLNDPELFVGAAADGYIFAGGRINAMKRQHLLVEAVRHTPANVRLVVAGPPDSPEDGARMERLVEGAGLRDRVKLDLRFLARREIADYVNRASAVACLPYDEDSLSYVAMEGAAAGKPVISTRDSGGVLRLVRHAETGWLADPQPAALAEGMAYVSADPARAEDMGRAARLLWTELEVSWPKAVERLLS